MDTATRGLLRSRWLLRREVVMLRRRAQEDRGRIVRLKEWNNRARSFLSSIVEGTVYPTDRVGIGRVEHQQVMDLLADWGTCYQGNCSRRYIRATCTCLSLGERENGLMARKINLALRAKERQAHARELAERVSRPQGAGRGGSVPGRAKKKKGVIRRPSVPAGMAPFTVGYRHWERSLPESEAIEG